MLAICKLYEEWLEVMEDYAAVFSCENGLEMPAFVPSDGESKMVS